MTNGDDIQERLIQFTDKIITLCNTLPPTTTAEHIAGIKHTTKPPPNPQLKNHQTTRLLDYQTTRLLDYQTTKLPNHLRFRQKKNEVKTKPILSRPGSLLFQQN